MVKRQNKDSAGRLINQGENGCLARATRIGASTAYEYCSERLSPFGGLLGLVKFMDAVKFKEIFDGFYKLPARTPEIGHYSMVYGIIILLFIGFNRIWHFVYIRIDPMLCSIFNVVKLPYVTTYWRYVDSLGINQGKSLLDVMSALRERVWQLCGISYRSIHINIDTTVETIYGKQQDLNRDTSHFSVRYPFRPSFRSLQKFSFELIFHFNHKLLIAERSSCFRSIAQQRNFFFGYIRSQKKDIVLAAVLSEKFFS